MTSFALSSAGPPLLQRWTTSPRLAAPHFPQRDLAGVRWTDWHASTELASIRPQLSIDGRPQRRYYSLHMTSGYRTGKDVVSGRLYHYGRFRPEWLEGTLRNRQIHCSDPAKLNDPWDCRVSFDYAPMLRDPLEREKMLALHRAALPPET